MAQIQTGVRLSPTSTFSICTQKVPHPTHNIEEKSIDVCLQTVWHWYRNTKNSQTCRGVHVLLINLEKQCEEIQRKANRVLAVLQRKIHSVQGHAYYALVRPITEYSSTTWSPYTSKDIASVEEIQRRAARFVSNDYRLSTSVSSFINELGWKSLRERKVMSDFILQNPKQQACRAFQWIWLWIRRVLESYTLKLTNYFQPELVLTKIPSSVWNSLPVDIIKSTSLTIFIERLTKHVTVN